MPEPETPTLTAVNRRTFLKGTATLLGAAGLAAGGSAATDAVEPPVGTTSVSRRSAPSSSSRRAMARPKPCSPPLPVTIATLPSRFSIDTDVPYHTRQPKRQYHSIYSPCTDADPVTLDNTDRET